MTYQFINIAKQQGVAYIQLIDSKTQNEWHAPFIQELRDVAIYLRDATDIKVVVVGSSADEFSIGSRLPAIVEEDVPQQYQTVCLATEALELWAKLPYPIIMAIHGQCTSLAFSFACIADIRIIAEDVQLAVPELAYGLVPAGGITQRLPRLIGKGAAMNVLLGQSTVTAEEAMALGLATIQVTREELWQSACAEGLRLSELSTLSLQYTKECLYRGSELPFEQGLRLELDVYLLLQTSRDRMEGVQAFLEKRKPYFIGE
ncbi:enoyl-CoA hydratase/isomerase family protein [Lysinibacillus sp. FSL W8-0992]|uniref:enoyl-CoA hydratase/isomerase family protein n=1 Tax=Lysinibacillus sp. FSL W8-0992 TaxID=2954643 RepID=UPI0030F88971